MTGLKAHEAGTFARSLVTSEGCMPLLKTGVIASNWQQLSPSSLCFSADLAHADLAMTGVHWDRGSPHPSPAVT